MAGTTPPGTPLPRAYRRDPGIFDLAEPHHGVPVPPPGRPRSGAAGAALAWLAHPVTLVAVLVLVVNDQLLKAAYPGLLTGKLSDVAGLVVAPPLLALAATLLVPRLPGRVAGVAAVALAGVGFAVVKSTEVGAAAASTAWSLIAGPSVILADPTDLATLPALALAWWAWTRARRRPAPPRLVRLARIMVVLPAAALAVAATSAPDYPYAASVTEWEGAIVLGESDAYGMDTMDRWSWSTISVDGGESWRPTEPGEADAIAAARGYPLADLACVPYQETHCYRVVPGQLRVEETRDGGFTWTTSWEITDEQRETLFAHYPSLGDPARHLSSRAVAVVQLEGLRNHVVVVANGRDGFAVYDDRYGQWRRIGFPDQSEPPPAVGEQLRDFPVLPLWGLLAGLLSLAVATEVLRRRRAGSWRWLDKVGAGVLAAGVAALFVAVAARNAWQRQPDPEPFLMAMMTVAAVLLALCGLVLWLVLLVMGRVLAGRQWLVLVPASVAVGIFVALTLQGVPGLAIGYPVTVLAAVLGWGAGTLAGITLAWAVGGEVSPAQAMPARRSR